MKLNLQPNDLSKKVPQIQDGETAWELLRFE